MSRARASLAAALVLASIAWVYGPLHDAGFVYWDDRALFTNDADVAHFNLLRFFTDLSPGGYFPLVRVSLAVDHWLFGYDAFWSHAINVGLHVVNVGLVYLAAHTVFALARPAALTVAALFAVHPLAVESVAWVSGGRKDLLCTLFYLLTITLLARRRSRGAFVTGLLALSSKAIAVTLVPWAWFTRHRKFALLLLPFAVAIGILEISAQRTGLRLATEGDGVLEAMKRGLTSLAFGLSRSILPRGLTIYYDRALVRLDGWDALVLAALGTMLASVLRRKDHRAMLGLGFFFLALAPTLKLVPFGQDSAFNDRYLYLPSLGLLVFVVSSLDRVKFARALLVGPMIAFAWVAHAQSRVWLSQETLWLNVDAKYPGSRKVAPNLSLFYLQSGEYEKGLPYARRAVEEESRDLEARSNLGVLFTRMGRLEDARQTLSEALMMAPDHPMLLNNLGWVFLEAGDRASARAYFLRTLERAPDLPQAREGLARANAP